MKNTMLGLLLVVAGISATSAAAQESAEARYDRSLAKVYDLTYGKELSGADVDGAVAKFRDEVKDKPEFKNCPGVRKAMDEFANVEFRQAMVAYLQAPEIKAQILSSMRKHYTQADLDAYLAFAETPAGASYLQHSGLAEAEVKRGLEERLGKMDESPEMRKMITEMVVKLMPAMLACKEG